MDNISVQPVVAYFPEYSGLYEVLLESTIRNPDMSTDERLRRFSEGLKKLREQFRTQRADEYKSKAWLSHWKSHSCTKGSSGGTKRCGWKYIDAPLPGMITKAGEVEHDGRGKVRIKNNGQRVGIYLEKSGRGKKKGKIRATFRFSNSYISGAVERDQEDLFLMVSREYSDDFYHVDVSSASSIADDHAMLFNFEDVVEDDFTDGSLDEEDDSCSS